MDWVTALNVAGPIAGIMVGGFFGRKKTKADAHSAVVTDAVAMAKSADDRADAAHTRLDQALRRIDDLEDRERARDTLARAHLRWDWARVRQLADLGYEVTDPPSLFLYEDNPTKGS